MKTVSVEREFDAPEHRVQSVLEDVTGLFEAAGFDVDRDGDHLELSKRIALLQFELTVRLREDEPAALAYEQSTGPFESMTTQYHVDPIAGGSRLTVETSFAPPASGFGSFLNEPAVERQRRAELDAVASLLESSVESSERANETRAVGTGGD